MTNAKRLKILLTGATGTMGREVLRQLVETAQFDLVVFPYQVKQIGNF